MEAQQQAADEAQDAKAVFRLKAARRMTKKRRACGRSCSQAAVVADLAATAAAAAARQAARKDGSECGGDPTQRASRLAAMQRIKRAPKEPTPFERDLAATAALARVRSLARADGGGDGGDEHARELRREANARLKQRIAEIEAEIVNGRRAARVAIVGAGPVGLWLAVLLARRHATIALGANGQLRIVRNSNAPTIDVYEARRSTGSGDGDGKAHGERQVVLAITQATQDLLNRYLLGASVAHCATHSFSPTSRIGEISRDGRASTRHSVLPRIQR